MNIRISTILLIFGAAALTMIVFGGKKEDFKYVGSLKCGKPCHFKKEDGAQHSLWMESLHAEAYKSLLTEEAADMAENMGADKPAHQAPECLKCHSTAWDPESAEKRKNLASSLKEAEGVGCESCHGPGSVYLKKDMMKDRKKFLASGGILAGKKVCVSCHNEESPYFMGFDYEEYAPMIAHPVPRK